MGIIEVGVIHKSGLNLLNTKLLSALRVRC